MSDKELIKCTKPDSASDCIDADDFCMYKKGMCSAQEIEAPRPADSSGSSGLCGYVHKGWVIEYMPKSGPAGTVDYDATHPEEEMMINGRSVAHCIEQINDFISEST